MPFYTGYGQQYGGAGKGYRSSPREILRLLRTSRGGYGQPRYGKGYGSAYSRDVLPTIARAVQEKRQPGVPGMPETPSTASIIGGALGSFGREYALKEGLKRATYQAAYDQAIKEGATKTAAEQAGRSAASSGYSSLGSYGAAAAAAALYGIDKEALADPDTQQQLANISGSYGAIINIVSNLASGRPSVGRGKYEKAWRLHNLSGDIMHALLEELPEEKRTVLTNPLNEKDFDNAEDYKKAFFNQVDEIFKIRDTMLRLTGTSSDGRLSNRYGAARTKAVINQMTEEQFQSKKKFEEWWDTLSEKEQEKASVFGSYVPREFAQMVRARQLRRTPLGDPAYSKFSYIEEPKERSFGLMRMTDVGNPDITLREALSGDRAAFYEYVQRYLPSERSIKPGVVSPLYSYGRPRPTTGFGAQVPLIEDDPLLRGY